MATIADLLVRIGVDADDLESGMSRASGFVDDNFAKIAGAGVAAGAGLESFARKSQATTEPLRRLGAAMDSTEGEMRDLVRETANVTFAHEEVIAVMESGRQQGIRSADQLQEFARFWDMVGDATGESAAVLSDAGVALRAVGIAAGDEGEALGSFGFIAQETTQDVGEFLQFIERAGPELREMGAGVDEAAAIMGVLEQEFGMTARVARQEFRQAVNEADGDMNKMLETLGVSEDQFEDYMGAVSESSDVIERNAAIHADSFTPMQKLTHAAEDLMFRYGGLADAAGMLALPMLALGPIMKGITTVIPALVTGFGAIAKGALVATKAIGAKVVAWTVMGAKSLLAAAKVAAAWLIAFGPIALVIAAVVGLVALVVKNWDTIVEVTGAAWDWVVGKFEQASQWVTRTWDRMWTAVRRAGERALTWVRGIPGRILSALQGFATTVLQFVNRYHPVAILWRAVREAWPAVFSWLQDRPQAIVIAFRNLPRMMLEVGKDLVRGLWDGIKDMGSWLAGKISSFVTDRIPGPIARALGIGSPSKVAADLAREVPRGMALGLEAEASTLARAAERMAQRALPDLAGTVAEGTFSVGGDMTAQINAPDARPLLVENHNVVELDGRVVYRSVKREAAKDRSRNVSKASL